MRRADSDTKTINPASQANFTQPIGPLRTLDWGFNHFILEWRTAEAMTFAWLYQLNYVIDQNNGVKKYLFNSFAIKIFFGTDFTY